MAYRIKCKHCETVLDYESGIVYCQCGAIMVDGVNKQVVCKKDSAYSEVDDMNNEIVLEEIKLTKKDRIKMLEEMIKSYENLPQNAMITPVNHYDFVSGLLLLLSILRDD